MILAIGIDLQRIDFFQELLGGRRRGFLEDRFTEDERDYSLNPPHGEPADHLATRYAAKEAFLKALGTTQYGFPPEIDPAVVNYKEIEVARDEFGRPFLKLHGRIEEVSRQRGVKKAFVSLSHDKEYAIAQVVLEG